LDEVGELPLTTQVKLLRALQQKKIVRVGESEEIAVDVRVVSATNRDLAATVRAGAFREDLYYRLAVLMLRVPPLREREGDIGLLADHLMAQQLAEMGEGGKRKGLSPGARNLLLRHDWPGNVRELEATLLRALVWSKSASISEADMRDAFGRGSTARDRLLERPLGEGFDLQALLDEVSTHYIRRAVHEAGGKKTKAAELIGFKSHQRLMQWAERRGVDT
ncbi:MAG: sigma 54-interacting transcriptional regulator, partial [Deltaproteobacteria bacterium]